MRRYTLTVQGDSYTLMSALADLAEELPDVESKWEVASDEAIERGRLADEAISRTKPFLPVVEEAAA